MPSASGRRDGRTISGHAAVLLTLRGFRVRHGIDPTSPKTLVTTAARIGNHDGLARVFGRGDPRELVRAVGAASELRVAYFEKELIARARPPAAGLRLARIAAADARESLAALRPQGAAFARAVEDCQLDLDAETAKLPDPPTPLAPTAQELQDAQDDAEPVYAPTAASKVPQRLVEVALDLVTFYPLLASAALGSVLLGVTGSRLLVFVMALAASLGLPLAACRLGGMTVEGALRDHRRATIAWGGYAVLMTVPVVVGVARALHVMEGQHGGLAAGLGVFGISLLMIGIIVLEFAQGRRAAHGVLVAERRRVAAEQRHERRHPAPHPTAQAVVAAEERLAEAKARHKEHERCTDEATTRLRNAEQEIESSTIELREIRADGLRMAREEHELARLAATEALRMSGVNLRRYGRPEMQDEPEPEVLIDGMPTPTVFDPFDLVADEYWETEEAGR